MYQRIICQLLFFVSFSALSQQGQSKKQLLDLLKTQQHDTLLIDTYNELIWPVYSYDNPDSSFYYAEKAIALSTQLNDIKRLSIAHRRIGITYTNVGETKKSIVHQQESYDLSEKINYKKGMQLALNNIGVAYLNNDLLTKALPYFLKSLRLAEELDNLATAGKLYYNCAQIYKRTGDVEKSNHFLYRSVHCAQMQHDTDLLVVSLNGLSTGYRNINQLDSAVYYASLSEKLIQDGSSSGSKFSHYLNKGLLNMQLGDHQKALQAFLDTRPYVTVAVDEITLLINIAEEYKNLRNMEKALAYFNEALVLSEKSKTYNNLAYISYAIAKIYEDRGDYKKFSEMIHLHLNYKDSNDKYVRVQQIHQQQLEFDYERKQVADSLRFLHKESLKNSELEVAAARLSREKSFRLMLVVVLVIIILFSVFISNRFLLTRRQKQIIERQKQIVELKNREIFDSINYAKRLQAAILPQLTNIQKELNLDILYLPKDIIGGDFYFYEKYQDFVFFAVCDCTGHGIPGALMSVVCHHALQKSIREFNLTEPGLILTKAREIVIDSLNAHQQSIKDGMDCSLIAINKRSKKISWAGANNHVWIVNSGILLEIKADKQPVAYYENAREFVTRELPVTEGSLLYLFTDGYGDQFGGPKGKKYKNKSLKEFLLTISGESVEKQVELLQRNFTGWKRELDQVDDVAIGVIRV